MILFVTALRWRYSVLSGALTLAIMVLPLILRTTEEALLSVPDSYREGSLGPGRGQAAHGDEGGAASGLRRHFRGHHPGHGAHCGRGPPR